MPDRDDMTHAYVHRDRDSSGMPLSLAACMGLESMHQTLIEYLFLMSGKKSNLKTVHLSIM